MKKKVIIGIIVLSILVVLLFVFVRSKVGESSEVDIPQTNIGSEEIIDLDIESEEVQYLHNMLLIDNELGANIGNVFKEDEDFQEIDVSFYQDKKVTLEDLSNEEKIIAVLSNVNKDEIEVSSFSKLIDTISYAKTWFEQYEEDREIEVYTAEVLNNTAKRIFGQEVEIEYKTLDLCGTSMEYIDGNYYKYDYEGGGLGYTEKGYSQVKKAEKQGEFLYIYDKFLYCDEEIFFGENGEILFYTSVDKNVKVDIEVDYENLDYENGMGKLISENESKLNTYKHTFKKGEDGNYYWLSTEISEK